MEKRLNLFEIFVFITAVSVQIALEESKKQFFLIIYRDKSFHGTRTAVLYAANKEKAKHKFLNSSRGLKYKPAKNYSEINVLDYNEALAIKEHQIYNFHYHNGNDGTSLTKFCPILAADQQSAIKEFKSMFSNAQIEKIEAYRWNTWWAKDPRFYYVAPKRDARPPADYSAAMAVNQ